MALETKCRHRNIHIKRKQTISTEKKKYKKYKKVGFVEKMRKAWMMFEMNN